MNTDVNDLVNAFLKAYGNMVSGIISPEGREYVPGPEDVLLIVSGTADLFAAERLADGMHGRPLPVVSRLASGTLIPPLPGGTSFMFYIRILPESRLAVIPYDRLLKAGNADSMPLASCCQHFTESAGWKDIHADLRSLRENMPRLAETAKAALEQLDEQKRLCIRRNLKEQESRKRSTIEIFSSFFSGYQRTDCMSDPSDPAAAAAKYTALQVGIEKFILPAGKNLRERLSAGAGTNGIRVTPVNVKPDWYKQPFLPMLTEAADGSDYYCVYYNGSDDAVAWSGATGKIFVVDEDFSSNVSHTGWNLIRCFPEGPITLKAMAKFCRCEIRSAMPLLLTFLLIGALVQMAVPVINSLIFSNVIPHADRLLLGQLAFLLILASLVKFAMHAASVFLLQDVISRAAYALQMAIFDRVLRLPVNHFRDVSAGEISMQALCIRPAMLLLNQAASATLGLSTALFAVLLMFYYSAKLAFIMFLVYVGTGTLSLLAANFISRYKTRFIREGGKLTGELTRYFDGIGKLLAAGAESHAFLSWSRGFAESLRHYRLSFAWNGVLNLIAKGMPGIVFCCCAACLIKMFDPAEPDSMITMADYAGFLAAAAIVSTCISSFLTGSQHLLHFQSYLKWLEGIRLTNTEDVNNIDQGENMELEGRLELQHVSFSYQEGVPVLKDVSIRIEPGEFIAITGESGSGKSTLLRLMLRFEQPSSGTVMYDRKDIRCLNMKSIRSKIGVVLQNAGVMPQTILQNIIGGCPEYTMDDAWEAAEMANCADEIRSFPMQMQTMLCNSVVSGGQKQRILIARALVRKPKLLFLDEATSALDNCSQHKVIESLKKVKSTKIMIAHRLSTIMDADRIYFLDKGSIAEVGTYRELIQKNGLFAQMAMRQMLDKPKENL